MFCQLFKAIKLICCPFWALLQAQMTDFPTLLYTSNSGIPTLSCTWSLKEPSCIGHHKEYPPPPGYWCSPTCIKHLFTWPASMLIFYWNTRNHLLLQDCQMVHQHDRCLIFLERKCGLLWFHATMAEFDWKQIRHYSNKTEFFKTFASNLCQ